MNDNYHENKMSYERLLRTNLGYKGTIDRGAADLDSARRHVAKVIENRPDNIAEVTDQLAVSLGLESAEMRRIVNGSPVALDEVCYVVNALLPYLRSA